MKLIIFPLGCLILLSLLSMTGLGDTALGTLGFGGDPSATVYYDSGGHALIYANGTIIGESGIVTSAPQIGVDYAYWDNGSILLYQMYWDNAGAQPLTFANYGQTSPSIAGLDLDVMNSFGLLALIVGIMAIAVVVGLRILGSGVSDISVGTVILGSSYLAIWGVFSVLSLDLLTSANELIVSLIYFILTAIYAVGVVQQIGGTGND